MTVVAEPRKTHAGAKSTRNVHTHNGQSLNSLAPFLTGERAPNGRSPKGPVALSNFSLVEKKTEGGTELVAVPKAMNEIVAEIHAATGNWPRRVGEAVFVDDALGGMRWFDRNPVATLFAWMRSQFAVEWRKGGAFVSPAELNSQLSHVAEKYAAVEMLPHEPPIENVYYRCTSPAPGDGSALEEFLDRFRPATNIDRQLIKAAILTTFWGGPPGMRPVFTVTSDDGRGVGKSKCVDLIARLAGGALDVDAGCDIGVLKERLLSPAGLEKRVAVLDNVKSLRFSWAELEKLVTAPGVSGKKLYVGEDERPNYLTWFLSLNGVALGDDMAQRSVIIKVVRGTNSGTWYESTLRFLDEHRQQLIGDIIAALRGPRNPLARHSRWDAWEHAVLSRLPNPDAIQTLIAERQNDANCELDEAELIVEYFAARLRDMHYDPATALVHIPNPIAADWYGKAVGEKMRTAAASKRLSQLMSEKKSQSDDSKITRIQPNPCRVNGRGLLWVGDATGPKEHVDYELETRVVAFSRRGSP